MRVERAGTTDRVITVDEVAETYVAAAAVLDPVGATPQGVAGHESELTDFSPAGVEARAELARRTRLQVQSVPPADEREQLAADVRAANAAMGAVARWLAAFHARALALGPMGLAELSRRLEHC